MPRVERHLEGMPLARHLRVDVALAERRVLAEPDADVRSCSLACVVPAARAVHRVNARERGVGEHDRDVAELGVAEESVEASASAAHAGLALGVHQLVVQLVELRGQRGWRPAGRRRWTIDEVLQHLHHTRLRHVPCAPPSAAAAGGQRRQSAQARRRPHSLTAPATTVVVRAAAGESDGRRECRPVAAAPIVAAHAHAHRHVQRERSMMSRKVRRSTARATSARGAYA